MSVSHAAGGLSDAVASDGERNRVGLLEMLARLADPRSRQGRRHELVFVLACAVVATLAGATNYRQVAAQVADLPQSLLENLGARWNWFRRRFDWPREATIRRVLQDIDAGELDRLVGAWLAERACRDSDGLLVIAVDGKVLRGAWTDTNGQVTLFSAMTHGTAVTVAQLKVPDGTNEITQVKPLLQHLADQQGRPVIVTLDAAHTQQETAAHIAAECGFDYVMTVKGNQPTLQKEVWDRCLPLLAGEPHHTVTERGHGRTSRWSVWTTHATGIDFPHATQAACIRRDVFALDGVRTSKELALVLTSAGADRAGPADLHTHVRQHWGIENKSHYVRDTTWREDHHNAYTGNGPYSMAILRNLALGLFRLNGIHKIKEATEHICRDRNRALPLLAT
jgi:predicted transposase YbfD/YdcC